MSDALVERGEDRLMDAEAALPSRPKDLAGVGGLTRAVLDRLLPKWRNRCLVPERKRLMHLRRAHKHTASVFDQSGMTIRLDLHAGPTA